MPLVRVCVMTRSMTAMRSLRRKFDPRASRKVHIFLYALLQEKTTPKKVQFSEDGSDTEDDDVPLAQKKKQPPNEAKVRHATVKICVSLNTRGVSDNVLEKCRYSTEWHSFAESPYLTTESEVPPKGPQPEHEQQGRRWRGQRHHHCNGVEAPDSGATTKDGSNERSIEGSCRGPIIKESQEGTAQEGEDGEWQCQLVLYGLNLCSILETMASNQRPQE